MPAASPGSEVVRAVVLDVGVEERIAGHEAASGGRRLLAHRLARKNEVVTVTVLEVRDGGLEVQIGDDGATGFIKRADLSRDRDEQRPERFAVGQKFDAMVTGFDKSKKPTLSIKAMQIAEEKQAVAQYGSSDSGASLGDILGAALNKAREDAGIIALPTSVKWERSKWGGIIGWRDVTKRSARLWRIENPARDRRAAVVARPPAKVGGGGGQFPIAGQGFAEKILKPDAQMAAAFRASRAISFNHTSPPTATAVGSAFRKLSAWASNAARVGGRPKPVPVRLPSNQL